LAKTLICQVLVERRGGQPIDEKSLRRALEIFQFRGQTRNRHYLTGKSLLAITLSQRKEYAEAESAAREALDGYRRWFKDQKPDYLDALKVLIEVKQQQRDASAETEALLNEMESAVKPGLISIGDRSVDYGWYLLRRARHHRLRGQITLIPATLRPGIRHYRDVPNFLELAADSLFWCHGALSKSPLSAEERARLQKDCLNDAAEALTLAARAGWKSEKTRMPLLGHQYARGLRELPPVLCRLLAEPLSPPRPAKNEPTRE
jgi:hypothetical protein